MPLNGKEMIHSPIPLHAIKRQVEAESAAAKFPPSDLLRFRTWAPPDARSRAATRPTSGEIRSRAVGVESMEAPWRMMQILVDRFIYQGLRHAPGRHTVPDQPMYRAPLDQDETLSAN